MSILDPWPRATSPPDSGCHGLQQWAATLTSRVDRDYLWTVRIQRAMVPADTAAGGEVDYRLARESVLADLEANRLGREDVCDAHPELRRAAVHCGEPTGEDCPVCGDVELVWVRYVFGPRLPSHGRCISTKGELTRLAARKGTFTCYVVEVCAACAWNHLRRSYILG
jgi:hypothetical protein